jgi:uncharacterized protein (DUF305 family)
MVAVLTLVAIGAFALPPGTASSRQATPDAERADPCVEVLAAGTPVASHGEPAIGALDPVPGEQTGALGDRGDYPFDLVFVDAMTADLEAATELAGIALVRAEREETRIQAVDLIASFGAEAAQLAAARAVWYAGADPVPRNVVVGLLDEAAMRAGIPADAGQGGMGGPATSDPAAMDLVAVCSAGAAFDLAFLDAMIRHHQRAIGLALLAQERAEHPDLRAIADTVLAARGAEVATMTALRTARAAEATAAPAAVRGARAG